MNSKSPIFIFCVSQNYLPYRFITVMINYNIHKSIISTQYIHKPLFNFTTMYIKRTLKHFVKMVLTNKKKLVLINCQKLKKNKDVQYNPYDPTF